MFAVFVGILVGSLAILQLGQVAFSAPVGRVREELASWHSTPLTRRGT